MRVVVINTGTELLLGSVLNTHLVFIAREIFPFGLRVTRQLTVPDGSAIAETLAAVLPEADLIFVTGGLGPTTDDVTREATAELLGLNLQEDATVAATIRQRLATRGFPMTDRILRQAQVPEGARILSNNNGTAPGLYLTADFRKDGRGVHLFLLPGPPRELEPIFHESVVPILRELAPAPRGTGFRTFKIAGIGESVVEAAIGSQLLQLAGLELGYCARPGEVDVRVLGPVAALEEAEAIISKAFPNSIYTTADERLEHVVVRLLRERNETVSTAESCTGGYLAHRLTNVPGASAVFQAGYVTYANAAKMAELGVETVVLQEHGAVSKAVARQMADGARRKARATYALAITGIAGPDGGTDGKPVGTVFIALTSDSTPAQAKRFSFQTDRKSFKRLATQAALEMLRQRLINCGSPIAHHHHGRA